jgi:exosortase
MTSIASTHPQSIDASVDAQPKSLRRVVMIGAGCWILASFILVYFHFSHTLAKPHYQYVIFVPPVIAFLLWNRHSQNQLSYSATSAYLAVLWLVPLAILALASWFFSPWIAMAAIVLMGPVTSVVFGGWPLLRSTWGIWLIAIFLLPLPLQSDERLIVALREFATGVTSRALDHFGVWHMLAGNVIELPEKKLFVADACSGIHSLFVLLAAAAMVAVWNRRGPIATTVLLVGTFGLVLVENIVRLLAVSLSIRVGYDLSEGTGHTVLGFVLFGISLLLILSLDQWIAFFSFKRIDRKRRVATTEMAQPSLTPGKATAFFALGAVGLALIPIQWMKMPAEIPRLLAGFSSGLKLDGLNAETLPDQVRGFRRVGHERIVRVADDPFGQNSEVWRFLRGQTELSISVNHTFREVHDPCFCYQGVGWTVSNETLVGMEDTGEPGFIRSFADPLAETPLLVADMRNPLEGNALIMYAMLSESGKVGVGFSKRMLGTTEQQAQTRFGPRQVNVPERWIQLQMTVLQTSPFTTEDRDEMVAVFRELQQILFDQCQKEIGFVTTATAIGSASVSGPRIEMVSL